MNKIYYHITMLLVLVGCILSSCYEDLGNYDYDEVTALEIDTVGMPDFEDYFSIYPGDTISIYPGISYDYPENLEYAWLVIAYPYEEEIVGNTTQYPAPDTISHTLELNWIVDLEPGEYRYYLMARDPDTRMTDYMQISSNNYLWVQSSSSFIALMCLSDYDGQTDIDVFYSGLALIFGKSTETHFYSNKTGEMIDGSANMMGYGDAGYYYAFTDQTGVRLDENEFLTMEDYSEMFYSAPVLDANAYSIQSNNELLINDGQLHVLNNNQSNDRKFSSAVAGDYELLPYISNELEDELCVVFDKQSLSFMKYFDQGSSLVQFGSSSSDVVVSPNDLPSEPLAIFNYDESNTCVVLEDTDGKIKAFLYNFNSDTEGDYSAAGSRSVVDLSDCEDIANATMFYGASASTCFHYVTSDAIYAFSISSGATTSTKIYDIPAGEEVTSIYSLPNGGFPTAGRVYWFATWNEAEQDGSIVEFELDPNSGEPDWFWGLMLGIDQPNPNVTSGFGKIKSMTVPL